MNHIIRTKQLTKEYKRFEKEAGLKGSVKSLFNRKFVSKYAVSNFDLTVEPGEFVGLIGPNGAGKTTLVKMLTGIIAPSSGEISVLGYYPNKLENAFKKQYAVVMGQKSQLFFELTPADTFGLFKELYDGATAKLFEAYQTHKKVTVIFENETVICPPAGVEVVEQDPHKIVLLVPRELNGILLSGMMHDNPPKDISVEEEDIGSVVERIYAGGGIHG